MTGCCCPVLLLGALLGGQREIATCSAADWSHGPGTPPALIVSHAAGPALEIRGPFHAQRDLERTIHDRRGPLDLAGCGTIAMDVDVDHPEAVAHVSLYFHSGQGWYTASQTLKQAGPQRLLFERDAFRTEDAPGGWDRIDTVRISLWPARPQDVTLRVRRLAGLWGEVVVVLPGDGRHGDGESRAARDCGELIAGMYRHVGLTCDVIHEAAVAQGGLEQRRLAILPHNPQMSAQTAAAIERWVAGGGKIVVCYSLGPRMAKLLGLEPGKYVHPEPPAQLAEMRFDTALLPGVPGSVRQASWNIMATRPADSAAQIVGQWFDSAGRPSGYAALLLHPHGAYFSHVLLPEDGDAKRDLLAALAGHLVPDLGREMARQAMAQAESVGPFASRTALGEFVRAAGGSRAVEELKAGESRLEQAQQALAGSAWTECRKQALAARQRLVEAYLRAQPSRPREGRAFWNHSGAGAYPGDWERSARELAAAGFNLVIPNMLWTGQARYASDILPRGGAFEQYGDQLPPCIAACRKHGLEVHVWKVNFNLSNAPAALVDRMRREHRTIVSRSGQPLDWLCPSHPENRKLECDAMLEVVRKYEVDGLHFDYIRYPGPDYCFCDGCRERFQTQSGRNVEHWPEDCVNGPRREEYQAWRCQQVTLLVERVAREARRIRPGVKISAAVFGAYPECRRAVGQDWVAWVRAGDLDFVCPMDYTESPLAFAALVENQLRLVEGRVPLYPGIGVSASHSTLGPDAVAEQIAVARKLGAQGFTLFDLTPSTARSILPGLGLGVGQTPAVPPHRAASPPLQ